MKLVNLTHKVLRIAGVVYPPHGYDVFATLGQDAELVQGFSCYTRTCTHIDNLPEPKDGVIYMASAIVAEWAFKLYGRTDFIVPKGNKIKLGVLPVLDVEHFRRDFV